jgi:hypothetical protein
VRFSLTRFVDWTLRLVVFFLSVTKPIAECVLSKLIYYSSDSEDTKKRLRVRSKNVPHFHSKSFGLSDFEQLQDTIAFLATTTKTSLFSRKDEHVE